MEQVLDLSLSPGSEPSLPVLPPGVAIEKGWRVRNTGACTWDSAYLLVPEADNPEWALDSQPVPVVGEVMPGGLFDFWIDLTTPLLPGSHSAFWTLQNSRGEAVGPHLAVGFETAALPTQTALPEVTLVASPLEILPGEDALISWSTIEAKAAYFYTFGQAWREHPVGVNGSVLVEPERTTTYELRAVMGDDSVEIRRITIEILPFDDPKILTFKLEPSNVIDLGQCVDIHWEIKGRVNTVKLFRDGNFFLQSLDEVGLTWDCPEKTGTHIYRLQVTGPGGTTEASRTLVVR
jgi:hypothetical protein